MMTHLPQLTTVTGDTELSQSFEDKGGRSVL
jgi:hypothetical protein